MIARFSGVWSRSRRWLVCAIIVVATGLGASPAGAAHARKHPAAAAPIPVVIQHEVRTNPASSTLDDAFKYLQLLAAGAAILGLYFIWAQLRAARAAARSQRTAEFSARWHAREFRVVMSPVLAYLDVVDARECVQKARAWEVAAHAEDLCLPRGPAGPDPDASPRACKNDVLYVIGFVENLALLYNRGELDRRIVAESFGLILVDWLRMSLWFLHYYRQVRGGDLFGYEWEKMVAELRKGYPSSLLRRAPSEPHPIYAELEATSVTPAVNRFYLPAELGRARSEEWLRCAELSLAHDRGGEGSGGARDPSWLVVSADGGA